MNSLNLEPLEKAIEQLRSGIKQSLADPDNELLRDGVIQRFEYTMDLSWKMIQRYLKHIAQVEESAIRTKKDLFREAGRLRLITNVEAWFGYYEARNETSHTYDPQIAEAVFKQAELFLPDAIRLLGALKHAA
jgi:nucleotidyltransferase substrate binding protein (TIGR01987 family)|uniref:Putative nucletidyltransferase n=1 Tax=Leptospirillum sp. Group II '5-way CG' TaxID=419541 RepID=B6AKW2_9BACT|nr:MAG: Putative nucletidyltransferase [Leptospirillum sp. Group II '5-way CG']